MDPSTLEDIVENQVSPASVDTRSGADLKVAERPDQDTRTIEKVAVRQPYSTRAFLSLRSTFQDIPRLIYHSVKDVDVAR